MALVSGITFGAAKADLATVVANGVPANDPRVLQRTNEAENLLLQQLNSKGEPLIPVGCMATYDVQAAGTIVFLPPELENAISVEVLGTASVNGKRDIVQGWYEIVNNATYADPNLQHDTPLDDLGLEKDPADHTILRRKYDYPGLQPDALVRVTGKKRFIAMKEDGDNLIIQNVPAVKSAILSLEHMERGAGAIQDAEAYLARAVRLLESEVKNFMSDPRRLMKRKAEYQNEVATATVGTLRYVRARLALEIPTFLVKGKSELTYLINRAVQLLVDNRNQLAIAGRISVHGSVAELPYLEPVTPDTQLSWTDYNQIRLLVQSFMAEGPEGAQVQVAEEYQKRAFEFQKSQMVEQTEKARHTLYTSQLNTYVSGTFGWMTARLALELPMGLALTVAELERLVSMSEMRIMERGKYKGTLRTLSASIHGGDVLMPRDVEAVVGADICGGPVSIRSIFFEYQKNGPGHCCSCEADFVDQGEVYFPQTGFKRRKFRFRGDCQQDVPFQAVVKIRWIQKEACDEMVIKNFEAIRLYSQGILNERAEKWNEAKAAQMDAIEVLDKELNEYLAGIDHVPEYNVNAGYGFDGIGGDC